MQSKDLIDKIGEILSLSKKYSLLQQNNQILISW